MQSESPQFVPALQSLSISSSPVSNSEFLLASTKSSQTSAVYLPALDWSVLECAGGIIKEPNVLPYPNHPSPISSPQHLLEDETHAPSMRQPPGAGLGDEHASQYSCLSSGSASDAVSSSHFVFFRMCWPVSFWLESLRVWSIRACGIGLFCF